MDRLLKIQFSLYVLELMVVFVCHVKTRALSLALLTTLDKNRIHFWPIYFLLNVQNHWNVDSSFWFLSSSLEKPI